MEKIKALIKKVCTKEVILYIVFGILTTVVNLGTFYIMNSLLLWDENVSNIIAIVLAVLFAYITPCSSTTLDMVHSPAYSRHSWTL